MEKYVNVNAGMQKLVHMHIDTRFDPSAIVLHHELIFTPQRL